MTIGFAATYLEKNQAAVALAADCRYSAGGQSADMALKTYALGRQVGAVAAGSALSVGAAAELTRGVADDHDRLQQDKPINFYSTVRLFAFCLAKVERENPWSSGSEVALAGFLENGSPSIAKVVTRRGQPTEVFLYAPRQCGSLIAFVGDAEAKSLLVAGVARTLGEGQQFWTERATAMIWYLSKHEGAASIGGGPAVAVCARGKNIHWPIVTVDGRTYLRGFDITESTPNPTGDGIVRLTYDEAWHSETDQNRTMPPVRGDDGYFSLSHTVEGWIEPAEIFEWKLTPPELAGKPDFQADRSVVAIVRPGEMPGVGVPSSAG
jgi:hypothetical protein